MHSEGLYEITIDGTVVDLDKIAANRNVYYGAYLVTVENEINLKIEIVK